MAGRALPNPWCAGSSTSIGSSFIRSPREAACACFPELTAATRLKLADTTTFETGAIAKVYRPTGR